MAPWTFDVKFPHGTQFTFGSLIFAAGENEDLEILPQAPEHPTLTPSFAPCGSCSGLDPCAGLYICTAKLVQGIPIMMSILRLLAGASSSSS
jgi:hypothetical protein